MHLLLYVIPVTICVAEYCKKLQKRQAKAKRREDGEKVSTSESEGNRSEDDLDFINHPFELKPNPGIILNIPVRGVCCCFRFLKYFLKKNSLKTVEKICSYSGWGRKQIRSIALLYRTGVGTIRFRVRYIRNPVYPNTEDCTKHDVSCF